MRKMNRLKGLVGEINTVYIDSTFFSSEYENFPEQNRSAKKICDIIKCWLSRSSKHVISLKMPARYGYELLFIEIGKILGTKIHVNEGEFDKYRFIAELDNIFTTISRKSRIHACFDYNNKNGKYLTCNPELDPSLILVIKPTAMFWKEWEHQLEIVKKDAKDNVRVCYSNHSSKSEIRDFLLYLKPKRVALNVLPTDPYKRQEMLDGISDIMAQYRPTISTNCRRDAIHWDNLSKLSKINFKFSKQAKESTEQLLCPPKRKKI